MAIYDHAPVEKQSFFEQVRAYNKTFWIANVMEMIERWAYYGVRTVLALYIVGSVASGGLEFNHVDKGNIYLWWAILQSFLPMFTGGFSDAFGYKKTIAVSITLKIIGYVLMATQTSFIGFATGCLTLATGTAVFKPGVQGLIAHSTNRSNASVGWGIFYQVVNIGGFLGPIYASFLRQQGDHTWWWVFAGNAALVALNFLTLLMFKEPEVPRPPKPKNVGEIAATVGGILKTSLVDILQPRLFIFILIFAGFWFSFNQLFDLLPNFIDDWVDTGMIAAALGWKAVLPENMLNINPATIVFLMLPLAYVASRAPALSAIIGGIFVSIVGILIAGGTMNGWTCAIGIFIFSLGEMLASPRTNDYMASIAPDEKKGQYLGYANVPNGIGWAAGSIFAGNFYEYHGDKVNFAREWLTSHGMSAEAVKAIPKDKVMETLAAKANMTIPQATQMLWDTHHPATIWYIIAGIGCCSLAMMLVYNAVITSSNARAREASRVVPAENVPVTK